MFGVWLKKIKLVRIYWWVHYTYNGSFWWVCDPNYTLKSAREVAAKKSTQQPQPKQVKIVLTVEFWWPWSRDLVALPEPKVEQVDHRLKAAVAQSKAKIEGWRAELSDDRNHTAP